MISILPAIKQVIGNEDILHIACCCLKIQPEKHANPRICGRITSCTIAPQATHPPYTQHVRGSFLLPILIDVTIECEFHGASSSLQRTLNGAIPAFIGHCCDVQIHEKLRDALKLIHGEFVKKISSYLRGHCPLYYGPIVVFDMLLGIHGTKKASLDLRGLYL